ncbi:MAG TPA: hypothetical protein ENN19_19065 [Chloroflexi bacterium]|nr:hypothetical protein [Chloroflexota bacterium]
MLREISKYTLSFLCLGLVCALLACDAKTPLDEPLDEQPADSEATIAAESLASEEAVLRPVVVKEIEVGQSGIVEIYLDHVVDLYGLQIRLTFDPDVLQVEDANAEEEGVQVTPGQIPATDFVAVNRADNERGMIEYVVTQLAPRDPVTGSGAVAVVHFQGLTIGTSNLNIEQALLSDKDGQAIPVSTQDGKIEVE